MKKLSIGIEDRNYYLLSIPKRLGKSLLISIIRYFLLFEKLITKLSKTIPNIYIIIKRREKI
jgi:hypothetical protein